VTVLVAALGAVVVGAAPIFLLAFGAILLAILLRTAADALGRWTGMGPNWAFGVLLLVLVLAGAGAVYFVGATADAQLAMLAEELPKAVERVREYLAKSNWGRQLLRWAPAAREAVVTDQPGAAAAPVASLFSTTFGAVGNVGFVLFLMIYLAATPATYVDGLIRLFPPRSRPRAREVVDAVGERLKGWMLAQLVGMVTVGVLSGVGLKLAGVPQYFVLALIVGLFNGIPYLGPIIGAIPGLLVAMTMGPMTVLWTFVAYAVAQLLESYIVTPLVQQRTTSMPPVLTLSAIGLAGMLFGAVGLIVATPLAVAVMTLVEELYVKDALGDREAA
jgi:predicted PurR-regulated permease PerM